MSHYRRRYVTLSFPPAVSPATLRSGWEHIYGSHAPHPQHPASGTVARVSGNLMLTRNGVTAGNPPHSGFAISPSADAVRPWNSLSADEKKVFSRMAEVYAGFSEYTDAQVGRIIDYLEGGCHRAHAAPLRPDRAAETVLGLRQVWNDYPKVGSGVQRRLLRAQNWLTPDALDPARPQTKELEAHRSDDVMRSLIRAFIYLTHLIYQTTASNRWLRVDPTSVIERKPRDVAAGAAEGSETVFSNTDGFLHVQVARHQPAGRSHCRLEDHGSGDIGFAFSH